MRNLRKTSIIEALLEIRPGSFLFSYKKEKTVEPVSPGRAWLPNAPQTGNELRAIYYREGMFLLVIAHRQPATWLLWFALAAYALLQLHTAYRAVGRFRQRVRASKDAIGTFGSEPVQSPQKPVNERLISLEAIEAGIQNLTYYEIDRQKKMRAKVGDRKIESKLRSMQQKYWERSLHWALYKDILKHLTPNQVVSFYPEQGTPKSDITAPSPANRGGSLVVDLSPKLS